MQQGQEGKKPTMLVCQKEVNYTVRRRIINDDESDGSSSIELDDSSIELDDSSRLIKQVNRK